jgi:hypothetical protein
MVEEHILSCLNRPLMITSSGADQHQQTIGSMLKVVELTLCIH